MLMCPQCAPGGDFGLVLGQVCQSRSHGARNGDPPTTGGTPLPASSAVVGETSHVEVAAETLAVQFPQFAPIPQPTRLGDQQPGAFVGI